MIGRVRPLIEAALAQQLPSPHREVFEAREPVLPPYRRLAKYWAGMGGSRDYERILSGLLAPLSRTQHATADLACGAGHHTHMLAKRSRRVFAVDRSEEMLNEARRLAHGNNVSFIHGALEEVLLPEPVHLAMCIGDSMNYVLDVGALRAAIANIAARLVKGGAFVFDIMDETWSEHPICACIRHSQYDPQRGETVTFFQMDAYDPETRREEAWIVFEDALEAHPRQHFSRTQIASAAQDAGLRIRETQLVGVSLKRVFYVLEKPA